jgi:hypothetical protein
LLLARKGNSGEIMRNEGKLMLRERGVAGSDDREKVRAAKSVRNRKRRGAVAGTLVERVKMRMSKTYPEFEERELKRRTAKISGTTIYKIRILYVRASRRMSKIF